MDENKTEITPEESASEQSQPEVNTPRPAWQIWGARVALVVFILYLIMYYINIMRGGG